MTDLEQMIPQVMPLQKFWEVCRSALSGPAGIELRNVLASLSHPLYPPVGKDALETYRLIGRAEVVSLLLKYSEAEVTPATLIKYGQRQDTPTPRHPERTGDSEAGGPLSGDGGAEAAEGGERAPEVPGRRPRGGRKGGASVSSQKHRGRRQDSGGAGVGEEIRESQEGG